MVAEKNWYGRQDWVRWWVIFISRKKNKLFLKCFSTLFKKICIVSIQYLWILRIKLLSPFLIELLQFFYWLYLNVHLSPKKSRQIYNFWVSLILKQLLFSGMEKHLGKKLQWKIGEVSEQ